MCNNEEMELSPQHQRSEVLVCVVPTSTSVFLNKVFEASCVIASVDVVNWNVYFSARLSTIFTLVSISIFDESVQCESDAKHPLEMHKMTRATHMERTMRIKWIDDDKVISQFLFAFCFNEIFRFRSSISDRSMRPARAKYGFQRKFAVGSLPVIDSPAPTHSSHIGIRAQSM